MSGTYGSQGAPDEQSSGATRRKAERCAPRPRSTTPATSGSSKRLTNLPALRQIGFTANRRLLGVQRLSHDPIRGAQAFTDAAPRRSSPTPAPASPGCASATARAHALLQALLIHRLLPRRVHQP